MVDERPTANYALTLTIFSFVESFIFTEIDFHFIFPQGTTVELIV